MKKKLALLALLSGLFVNAQSSWSLTGNAGTTPGTNFIGTTDNQNLIFKTNNLNRIVIGDNGKIRFGTGSAINPNYDFSFWGNPIFNVDDMATSVFQIYNNPNDYIHFRVDGYNMIDYLQEDYGKVVIGSKTLATCSDCNNYKLFVKGGIRTEQIKVDVAANNGWADYVFKKDYKLMPLKEVEHFITNNGHLPEVPSTEEAIKNGIELKEMNILLLKKVEELTLYTIEQQKRIEALEKKVK